MLARRRGVRIPSRVWRRAFARATGHRVSANGSDFTPRRAGRRDAGDASARALLAVRRARRGADRRGARGARSGFARGALRGAARAVLDHARQFPPFDAPDYADAVALAQASRNTARSATGDDRRHRAALLVRATRRQLRDLFQIVGRLRRNRGARRRSARALRPRAVAAARLVPAALVPEATEIRTRAAGARGRSAAARGRIQHVLRRPAAASAS